MLTRVLYLLLDIVFPTRFREEDLYTLRMAGEIPDNKIFAVFSYKDERVKQIIKHLKRISDKELGKICASHIYSKIRIRLPVDSDWIVVPIPITRKRLRERGYNQVELLARSLVALDTRFRIETKMLLRNKNTKKQAVIKNRNERLKNQVGTMISNVTEHTPETKILIVDDVMTTGATFSEAIRALVDSGVKHQNIFCIALSH